MIDDAREQCFRPRSTRTPDEPAGLDRQLYIATRVDAEFLRHAPRGTQGEAVARAMWVRIALTI